MSRDDRAGGAAFFIVGALVAVAFVRPSAFAPLMHMLSWGVWAVLLLPVLALAAWLIWALWPIALAVALAWAGAVFGGVWGGLAGLSIACLVAFVDAWWSDRQVASKGGE